MKSALATHWPENLMEAAGLGIFMLSAGGFGTVLFHPASPIVSAVADPLLRRFLMGCASPRPYWPVCGRRSGST
jgi:aquaporin Z